ncbi:MAG: hypothetical protein ACYDIA_18705 [Candidatus Humimicrobiaceae bacterium]
MICRRLLLKLQSDDLIILPPQKWIPDNPFLNRRPPDILEVCKSLVECNLKDM